MRALLLLLPLLLVPASPAYAGCAPATSKYLAGTVRGQDGWDVNVQISFDIMTSSGVRVGLDGCKTSAYSHNLFLNRNLGYAGAPHSSSTTYSWQLRNLPSNAATVWIETWPRDKPTSTCCPGPVTTKKYGHSMRRAISASASRGDVRLTMPLACAAKGTTGTIWGRSYDRYGKPITITRIHAWSEAADSNTAILGWGPGTAYNGNYYGVNALASGQNYSVWANATGYPTKKILHVKVDPCRTTPLTIKFG